MICRHCQKDQVGRPRGLCWNCYYLPGVREQYPVQPHRANCRGHGLGNIQSLPLAPSPTDTMPGTEERVAVYAARVARGFDLWHPGDRRYFGN